MVRADRQITGAEPGEGAVVTRTSWLRLLFQWLLWSLLVLAIARPQFLEPPIRRVEPTRDLMLLVDLSGSMEAEDFTNAAGEKVDRLTAVKEVLDDFLTRREGDRVGLIVFGNAAFVQVPFTQDLDACRMLLEETAVRMAGPRTAFGDAIGLGITLFERSEVEDRVMIALTDGNDTGSKIPPAEAAKIADDNEIRSMSSGSGTRLRSARRSSTRRRSEPSPTPPAAGISSPRIATSCETIYDELDRLGTRDVEAETYRPRLDRFQWPLAVFLILGLLQHAGLLMRNAWRARRAAHG